MWAGPPACLSGPSHLQHLAEKAGRCWTITDDSGVFFLPSQLSKEGFLEEGEVEEVEKGEKEQEAEQG